MVSPNISCDGCPARVQNELLLKMGDMYTDHIDDEMADEAAWLLQCAAAQRAVELSTDADAAFLEAQVGGELGDDDLELVSDISMAALVQEDRAQLLVANLHETADIDRIAVLGWRKAVAELGLLACAAPESVKSDAASCPRNYVLQAVVDNTLDLGRYSTLRAKARQPLL